ncbi:MAG: hypothetical protein ACT4OI_09270 [Methanobacteriota archaeon]
MARRKTVPVLDFLFLVYRDGGSWIGRSVLTGHVSESRTFEGAVDCLTRAIDATIHLAQECGFSADEWYAAQEPDDMKYIRMFLETISHRNPDRRKAKAPSGAFVINAAVAKRAA